MKRKLWLAFTIVLLCASEFAFKQNINADEFSLNDERDEEVIADNQIRIPLDFEYGILTSISVSDT